MSTTKALAEIRSLLAADTNIMLSRYGALVDELIDHLMDWPSSDKQQVIDAYNARSRGLAQTILLAAAEHAKPTQRSADLLRAIAAVYRALCQPEPTVQSDQPLFEPNERVNNNNSRGLTPNSIF